MLLGEWFPNFWKDHGAFTITFEYEGPQSFKMSGSAHPVTQCLILEDWDPVQYLCDNLKSHRYKFTFTFWCLSYKH